MELFSFSHVASHKNINFHLDIQEIPRETKSSNLNNESDQNIHYSITGQNIVQKHNFAFEKKELWHEVWISIDQRHCSKSSKRKIKCNKTQMKI